MSAGFVVNRNRQESGTPMDQALEQVYNKPAKGAGGVIGNTRRKEAVAKWNILRHEKEGYTSNLKSERQNDGLNGETSLHHDYSKRHVLSGLPDVEFIIDYMKKVCNPFSADLDGQPIRNAISGEETVEDFQYVMTSLDQGYELYYHYVDTRFIEKSVGLMEPISRNKQVQKPSDKKKLFDISKETMRTMKYIEYAQARGFELIIHSEI